MFYELMKLKIELFGNANQQFVYRQSKEAYKEKSTTPTVKYGGNTHPNAWLRRRKWTLF